MKNKPLIQMGPPVAENDFVDVCIIPLHTIYERTEISLKNGNF